MAPINTHTTSGGGGGGGDGPDTLLDLDFTSLDAQNLATDGDGARTLSNGQGIHVSGTADVGTFAVDSSGLRIAVSGASGSVKTGIVSIDLSAYSKFAAWDQWRFWVRYKTTSMVGHVNGPAACWLTYEDALSGATNGILASLKKYKGDTHYSDNMALNGLSLGPPPASYSGGPSATWGNLGTSTVPSVARMELHGVDADVWMRGDTGASTFSDFGTLTQVARLRLQGSRFETSNDSTFSGDGYLRLYVQSYDGIDASIERLVIERYGAP